MRAIIASAVLPIVLPLALASAPADAHPRLRCHGHQATIVGTAGDDHLVGTNHADVIVGLGGADRIEGRGGDDVICGGANVGRRGKQLSGDDIDGGPGSDYIDPGRDRRRVGDQGYGDILRYSRATAGVRADLASRVGTVVVGPDTDTVRVAEGLWVLGSQYDDVIVGSRFDDDLEGNKGADELSGGPGDDGLDEYGGMLSREDRDADVADGGPGDDSIQANGGADVLSGGPGDDLLYEQSYGLARAMLGGRGRDVLWAFYDRDVARALDGGRGVDLIDVDNTDPYEPVGAQLVVDAGAGQVRSSVPTQAVVTVRRVERWQLSAEQRVVFLGTAGPDWVDARAVDRLTALTLGGDDVVRGSDGRDTIDAGDGTDRIDGRLGNDRCLGGERVRRCELSG
jgi:Ca2+-binding RTX toxin-like protein